MDAIIKAFQTCAKTNSNNNPGYVKKPPGDTWKGTTGYDARGHVTFENAGWGWRALLRTLSAKCNSGKCTIRAIMEDYAPANDTEGSIPGGKPNDPLTYAIAIGQWCGIDPYADLYEVTDDRHANLLKLACAISLYENGHHAPEAHLSDIIHGLMMFIGGM